MPHVRRRQAPPPAAPPRTTVPPQPQYGRPGGRDDYDDGYNTGQVYGGGGGGRGGGGYQDGPGGPGGRRPAPNWGRRVKVGLITFLVAALVVSVGTYMWASSKLRGEVDLAKVIERPEEGEGTNYLIVGSDSRDGMTDDDKKRLHTGSAEGKRTDSMMILHVGSNGNTMVSLPRDSEVEIPSFKGSESGKLFPAQGRRVKLNAAYAEDGPELLVRTVEYNTGLRIDHYAEIGFGGFANIVDALGGVEMDIPKAFKDKKSGADFQAGKQTLDGEQALAFVRTRYAFAGSDLDRTKNQQKFLATLANQAATPSTVLNPFRLYPTLGAGLDTLIVDKDMGLFDLASMFWAMKGLTGGEGTSMNMPISGSNGGNLVWDKAKKDQLMQQLRNDEKVTVTE
ncbi:LytR family transcriptional regulator [Streptomyces sp. SID4934]|uniref:LytR family transcriptional regulator n=5 Tax=Streptomyces TaxID=1883 RepID=A0AB37XEJ9_9ACTN|nr:LytR family transcriptional regulator [Streptomyces sp. SM17]MYQ74961.1 LytR family transcriptional regulator [Streptomyces sp. SID4934]RZD69297.1 LytR family transcriptional regulator [Streptomyces albidoflavus]RZE41642.1 LytR family transcriptional regulator [Streptomyces albidoflavus]RZE44761.1 LytR family transcriptional regulator [Streptomyces albidoflavus]